MLQNLFMQSYSASNVYERLVTSSFSWFSFSARILSKNIGISSLLICFDQTSSVTSGVWFHRHVRAPIIIYSFQHKLNAQKISEILRRSFYIRETVRTAHMDVPRCFIMPHQMLRYAINASIFTPSHTDARVKMSGRFGLSTFQVPIPWNDTITSMVTRLFYSFLSRHSPMNSTLLLGIFCSSPCIEMKLSRVHSCIFTSNFTGIFICQGEDNVNG